MGHGGREIKTAKYIVFFLIKKGTSNDLSDQRSNGVQFWLTLNGLYDWVRINPPLHGPLSAYAYTVDCRM